MTFNHAAWQPKMLNVNVLKFQFQSKSTKQNAVSFQSSSPFYVTDHSVADTRHYTGVFSLYDFTGCYVILQFQLNYMFSEFNIVISETNLGWLNWIDEEKHIFAPWKTQNSKNLYKYPVAADV